MTIIFIILLFFYLGYSDLPVHCDYNEIPGIWEYHIGRLRPKSGFNGENYDVRCGVEAPGDPDGWKNLSPGYDKETGELYSKNNMELGKYYLTDRFEKIGKLTLLLRNDATFIILDTEEIIKEIIPSDIEKGLRGTFSMVYDMGAMLKIKMDKNLKSYITEHIFWAPSKFTIPLHKNIYHIDFNSISIRYI